MPHEDQAKAVHGKYFPHIDGIRAIAVLPVLLFHIRSSLCPGGFTGVDVFFVISGYLITGGILRDLRAGRFSIANFYHRRIKRILPAYVVVILLTFAVGCILYGAGRVVLLADSVAAGTLFVANLHFWMLGGDYFGPQLHGEALLHLWSLSVEEQFYLLVPVVIAAVWKLRPWLVKPLLWSLCTASFAASLYAINAGDKLSAFYMIQYRAWELLAGALLACGATSNLTENGAGGAAHRLANEQLQDEAWAGRRSSGSSGRSGAAGVTLIALSYFALPAGAPFPGLTALPAVLGAVLLVQFGHVGWVGWFLTRPLILLVGKISYSLYLWHWPITVYWKYAAYDEPRTVDYLGMAVASFALGYVSWRFIELPVRASKVWSRRASFALAGVSVSVLVGLGTSAVHWRGWPKVLNRNANRLIEPFPRAPFVEARMRAAVRRIGSAVRMNWCTTKYPQRFEEAAFACGEDANRGIGSGGPDVVLLTGDSHAAALQFGLDKAFQERQTKGWVLTRSATRMYDLRHPSGQAVEAFLRDNPHVETVILSQYWRFWLRENKPDEATSELARLEEFARVVLGMGKKLYICTDVPLWSEDPCALAVKMRIVGPRPLSGVAMLGRQREHEYQRMQGAILQGLRGVCQRTGASLLSVHSAFWMDGHYAAFGLENGETISWYRDRDHLSPSGSVRAGDFICKQLWGAGRGGAGHSRAADGVRGGTAGE